MQTKQYEVSWLNMWRASTWFGCIVILLESSSSNELKYTKLEKITIIKFKYSSSYHRHHLGADLVFNLDDLEPVTGDRLELLGVDDLVDEPLLEGPPCGGAPEQQPSPSPTAATLDCTRIMLMFCILRWFNLHIIWTGETETPPPTFPHSRGASGCVDTVTHDQTTRTFGLKCCHPLRACNKFWTVLSFITCWSSELNLNCW